METMMSICLTWFPIGGLGEPNIYHDSGVFYKNVGDFTWRVVNMDLNVEVIEGGLVLGRKFHPPYGILTVIFTGLVLIF